MERLFSALGFTARRQLARERGRAFANLLLKRGPPGRALLVNTHTDTVPPGPPERWTSGPALRLTRRGSVLYGLGVADVKLTLLCQWEALRRIGSRGFSRPLCVAATYGEERGLRGARRLIRGWRGPRPVLALVGEPSEGRPINRHRGYRVYRWRPSFRAAPCNGRAFRLRVAGRSAHSSTPALGRNALLRGLGLLAAWERAGRAFTLVGLEGGTAANQVPASAVLEVVLGHRLPALPPWISAERMSSGPRREVPWREGLRALEVLRRSIPRGCSLNLGRVAARGRRREWIFDLRFPPRVSAPSVTARVNRAFRGLGAPTLLIDDPPLRPPRASPPLRLLRRCLKQAGLSTRWAAKATCTEAGVYSAWGVPSIVWGPGVSKGNVHRPNERISVRALEEAVRFYEVLFRRWCLAS